MIETHLLETFVTVVQTGSVSDAAEKLFRSQPAISHRLKELESVIGVPLFERVGRTIRPTAAGLQLYEESLDLVIRLRSLSNFADRHSDDMTGTLTIGSFPTLGRHFLFDAISTMLDEYPDLRVRFEFRIAEGIVAALRNADVDMIVAIGSVDTRGLVIEKIGSVEIGVAMSPEMYREIGSKVTLPNLRTQRYLAWRGPWDPSFETVDQFAIARGLVNDSTPEIPHIETLRNLAASGLGYALLPTYVCKDDVEAGRLVVSKLPRFTTTFPIVVGTRENQVLSPAAQAFYDLL